MIAMKHYLHFVLILLGLVFLPVLAYAQEHPDENLIPQTEQPNHASNEAPTEYNVLEEYPDLPRGWHEGDEKESDTFQAKFFKMLIILGLLIAFMMIASWSLKRMMRNKVTNMNQSSDIRVLETRYLSPRATLYLIEVEGKRLLIAESPAHVSYLTSMNQTQEETFQSRR